MSLPIPNLVSNLVVNDADPDRSGSILFVQVGMSQYLG